MKKKQQIAMMGSCFSVLQIIVYRALFNSNMIAKCKIVDIFAHVNNKAVKDNKNNNGNYDKIKHLVEVDDDILAVFIVMSSQIRDLYIAKGVHIDRAYVNSISETLGLNGNTDTTAKSEYITHDKHDLLGNLKWVVSEYENLRVLKIIEKDKIVVVLVNSNTQLQHTIDNILGYYYDEDDTPKSLF